MKRLCLAIGLGAVVAASTLGVNEAVAQGKPAPLKVVVTIKPVHSLVAQVMGEGGTPVLIVGGSASPHSYSLKPVST